MLIGLVFLLLVREKGDCFVIHFYLNSHEVTAVLTARRITCLFPLNFPLEALDRRRFDRHHLEIDLLVILALLVLLGHRHIILLLLIVLSQLAWRAIDHHERLLLPMLDVLKYS